MNAVNENDYARYASLCDPLMISDDDDRDYEDDVVDADDDDEGEKGGKGDVDVVDDNGERLRRIFDEYEIARIHNEENGEEENEASSSSTTTTTTILRQSHEVSNAVARMEGGTRAVVSYDRTVTASVGEGGRRRGGKGRGGGTIDREGDQGMGARGRGMGVRTFLQEPFDVVVVVVVVKL